MSWRSGKDHPVRVALPTGVAESRQKAGVKGVGSRRSARRTLRRAPGTRGFRFHRPTSFDLCSLKLLASMFHLPRPPQTLYGLSYWGPPDA